MIAGIGTDIVEIYRIENAMEKNDLFIERVLSEEEKNILPKGKKKCEFVAGRFAAKEAVSKAIGTGFREFGFSDISILNDDLGKPFVVLNEKVKKLLISYDEYKIHISISHEKQNAIAFVIIEV